MLQYVLQTFKSFGSNFINNMIVDDRYMNLINQVERMSVNR